MRKWLCEKKNAITENLEEFMPNISMEYITYFGWFGIWTSISHRESSLLKLSLLYVSMSYSHFVSPTTIFPDENLLGHAIRNRTQYLSDHINFSTVGRVDPYNNIDLPKVSKPQLCCINHPQAKYMCSSAQKDRGLTLQEIDFLSHCLFCKEISVISLDQLTVKPLTLHFTGCKTQII